MARKFFNQKVKKSSSISTGIIVVISICVLLIVIAVGVIISVSSGGKHKDAVIKMRDSVAVEINSELPDKTLFFAELENVAESDINVSYSNVDLAKIGEYEVTLKIYGKNYTSKLVVVDTESPELVLKDLSINVGDTYSADDFVSKCTDNSNEGCIIEFFSQEGSNIDYGAYTKEGTYTVQIIAKDDAGNLSSPASAKLTIGAGSGEYPTYCKYGNSEYDTNEYILAVNVTENGCALDLNLYQDEATLSPVKALLASEETKLKNEFKTLNLGVENIYVNSNINPVMNTSGTGVVGYTLFLELSILNSNGEREIIESYYVTTSGTRQYIVNTYNLK